MMTTSYGKMGHTKKAAAGAVVAALMSLSVLSACGTTATASPATTGTSAATPTVSVASSANTAASTTGAATTSVAAQNATPVDTSTTVPNLALQPVPTAAATSADQSLTTESNQTVSAVKQVEPAVVTVYNQVTAVKRGTKGGTTNPQTQGIGSGFIISTDGYIVTNAHVVQGQQALEVVFADGVTTAPAKLVGMDTKGDIAVIKVNVKVPAVAHFGTSSKLDVGETVLAIGSALGDYRNSVTKGIVSGLNRQIVEDPNGNIYIQTDAAINHGNSGGPLVDLNGNVIGINTAVVRSTGSGASGSSDVAEGLGFAIPSDTAQLIANQIIAKGSFARPFIGIQFASVTPATALELGITGETGAQIEQVTPNSPASKSGLQTGDVIKAVNDQQLGDNNPLGTLLLQFKPGDTIKLDIVRNKTTMTVNLTLGTFATDTNQ